MNRYVGRVCETALLAALLLVPAVTSRESKSQELPVPVDARPNLLFVLTDDQRRGTLQVMPATLENFNVDFQRAFVTTPVCCPARSSFLTGDYVHNTRVYTNDEVHYEAFERRAEDSIGPWLRSAGYYTGFVGKYFNEFQSNDVAPPGWDEFYGYNGDGADATETTGGHGYTQFDLKQRWTDSSGEVREEVVAYRDSYVTTVFADKASAFIERAEHPTFNPDGKPWALFVWTKAPHFPSTPERRYADAPVPAWDPPASFLERNMRDKPREVLRSPYRVESRDYHLRQRAKQLRTLMSVDDMVERVFSTIDRLGVRASTWGIFTSDNGVFWGEHRSTGKIYGYEEAIRVPLRMAVPGAPRRTVAGFVANIDIAPTLLDLAGEPGSHATDGRSLRALALGTESETRNAVLIEGYGEGYETGWIRYDGIRTDRWKYVRWPRTGHQELYDLARDPHEVRDVSHDRPRVVRRLRSEMERLKTG